MACSKNDFQKKLNNYLNGRTRNINQKFQLNIKSRLYKKILTTLKEKVSYGSIISYSDLAEICKVSNPRIIGNAMSKNPVPIIIPCHRVVKKNSDIGHYGPGVFYKQELLEIEKINMNS
ncbi:MAG: MGMT family protein [Candidatus Muiribacteriota bacterium]